MEGVYQFRCRGLQYFVDSQADLLNAFTGRVFLVGNSEGSMIASRFHHPALDEVMAGRILTAYACDYNYFVSCEESSQVCEDSCDTTSLARTMSWHPSRDAASRLQCSAAAAVAGALLLPVW